MAAAMVLIGRRLGSYGCAIQNGDKLETELIKIPMVDLLLVAAENHVCLFGGFTLTTCCTCATTAVAAMTTTNAVTLAAAAVMVTAKVRTMALAAMALMTAAMVARATAMTAAATVNLRL